MEIKAELLERLRMELEKRTTEQLKKDVITAQNDIQSMSNVIFCEALRILEGRLSKDEYDSFEDSL